MPTPAEQTIVIEGHLSQGRYDLAYNYIANQIDGDQSWDQRLVDWFEDAAEINGSEANFLKDWVFTSNALVAGLDPNASTTLQRNQQVSDDLA